MSAISKPKIYREVIDQLVEMCRHGQGQIGVRRAREGVWNANARADFLEDQHAANVLLSRLTPDERDVIARLLAAEVVTGVFETLKVLAACGETVVGAAATTPGGNHATRQPRAA